jgi:anti-sigma regulatory factor (Ser/Thr protein kinase)
VAIEGQAHFRHEALLYSGQQGLLEGTLPFIRAGLGAEEPILVAVSAAKIGLLSGALQGDAGPVQFVDMGELGANPARIIPAWRDFVSNHSSPGRGVRGIGEPVWPERSAAELVECQRHESLLNLAFADVPGFRLLCPYDAEALDPAVIDEARHSHPVIVEEGRSHESTSCHSLEAVAAPFSDPLPEPASPTEEFALRAGMLAPLRRLVRGVASGAGLDPSSRDDLVLAVDEVASNSVIHGGGEGTLRVWLEEDALICEIRDRGVIDLPLAGRERPEPGQAGGYGLWLANMLCDLVQVRSLPSGGVVRLHKRPRREPARH